MKQTQQMPIAGAQVQAGDEDQDQTSQSIAVIEVTVMEDGSITVETESPQQESAEESGGESAGAKPVTVSGSQEAGELVTHLIAQALSENGQPGQSSKQSVSEQQQGYEEA